MRTQWFEILFFLKGWVYECLTGGWHLGVNIVRLLLWCALAVVFQEAIRLSGWYHCHWETQWFLARRIRRRSLNSRKRGLWSGCFLFSSSDGHLLGAFILISISSFHSDLIQKFSNPSPKIPSEMEVAPCFKLLVHCLHCWYCLHCAKIYC